MLQIIRISSSKRLQVSISSVEIWEGKVMFVKELCGKKLCVHWILWLLWEKESGFPVGNCSLLYVEAMILAARLHFTE